MRETLTGELFDIGQGEPVKLFAPSGLRFTLAGQQSGTAEDNG